MKVLLVGNPNVGKSVVFNRLTGVNVISSNYPGTSVEFSKGAMRLGGTTVEVVDVPGTYSLDPSCRAEEVAVDMIEQVADDDIVLDVVDSTNLERSLNLTLQLLARRKPMVVALNMWDETKHTGIQIDAKKLEGLLGVWCVPTVAVTGVGIKELAERIASAHAPSCEFDESRRWDEIGKIVRAVQKLTHRHHTLLEGLGDASLRPVTGFVIAALVLFGAFEVIRLVGEGLIGYVFEPFFEGLWGPYVASPLSRWLGGHGFIHGVLIGKLEGGQIDFGESFGLLTTGLQVVFGAVLPYVFAFYLVLAVLEDFGYLPRLAVLLDNLMHRVGLHGMGIIPMLLGLGCNVPGALAARIMESRRERFIAATLTAIAVPCMAQIAMIVGLAGSFGAKALVPVFGTLAAVWLVLGVIMNRLLGGESPEILVDIPPYRVPYLRGVAKKVWMRLVWFLREAVPWVLAGVLLVNLLYTLKIIYVLGTLAAPVITGALGLPKEAAGGLVVGFLRKDVAVGMLEPLHLGLRQMIVACVVLAMYFPCVATFTVMIRELGLRDMLRSVGIMLGSTLIVGSLLNLVLWLILG